MMAPSYKNADNTILALIEALILNYVQQVLDKFMHIHGNICRCMQLCMFYLCYIYVDTQLCEAGTSSANLSTLC